MFLCFVCSVVGTALSQFTGNNNSSHGTESLKVLRAVRVLRPLKLVSGIPSKLDKKAGPVYHKN